MEFLLLVLVWEMHQIRMFSRAPGILILLFSHISQVDPSILFTGLWKYARIWSHKKHIAYRCAIEALYTLVVILYSNIFQFLVIHHAMMCGLLCACA